jgi:hypothetical protein
MSLFPEGNGLNKNHDPGIWSTTPEFGSKRTPHLRSTVPNVQRHMAYFALLRKKNLLLLSTFSPLSSLATHEAARHATWNYTHTHTTHSLTYIYNITHTHTHTRTHARARTNAHARAHIYMRAPLQLESQDPPSTAPTTILLQPPPPPPSSSIHHFEGSFSHSRTTAKATLSHARSRTHSHIPR